MTGSDMQDSWRESDGHLLRSLRERAGMDRSIFARTCSVSVAQLTELEDGGHGRFYTDRIKAHVGRGLLKKLGHVPAPTAPAPAPAPEVVPPVLAVPAVPQEGAPGQAMTGPQGEGSAALATPAQVPPATKFESAPPASRNLASRVAVQTPPHVTWIRAGFVAAVAVTLVVIMIPRKPRESRLQAEEAVAQASVAAAPVVTSAPATASLSITVPGISEAAASTPPAAAAAPEPRAAAGENQPATPAATVQVSATERRCELPPRDKVTEFTPPNALRSNNYVYLESAKDASVCVVDSQNRQTLSALKPGEGVSVYGTPPFTVQTRQWADLRMFFQGVRVPLDSQSPPVALLLNPR